MCQYVIGIHALLKIYLVQTRNKSKNIKIRHITNFHNLISEIFDINRILEIERILKTCLQPIKSFIEMPLLTRINLLNCVLFIIEKVTRLISVNLLI